MTITMDEAVEALEKEEEDTFMGSEKRWKGAVKLGYEALKHYRGRRALGMLGYDRLLPGETKE